MKIARLLKSQTWHRRVVDSDCKRSCAERSRREREYDPRTTALGLQRNAVERRHDNGRLGLGVARLAAVLGALCDAAAAVS